MEKPLPMISSLKRGSIQRKRQSIKNKSISLSQKYKTVDMVNTKNPHQNTSSNNSNNSFKKTYQLHKISKTLNLSSLSHKKNTQFLLPSLIQQAKSISLHNHKNEQIYLQLQKQILQTVKKLQNKITQPHNAAKKRNLQLIKNKRSSEYKIDRHGYSVKQKNDQIFLERSMRQVEKQMNNKNVNNQEEENYNIIKKQITLDQKFNQYNDIKKKYYMNIQGNKNYRNNTIPSCTLEEGAFYG